MQIPPEVIFHDVDRSAWVETYVLERVQRLERFADGITSCRVSLTQEQASHQTGNRYSVMVEVRMPPGHDLAAKKAKMIRDMPTQLPAQEDLGAAPRRGRAEDQRERMNTAFSSRTNFAPSPGWNTPALDSPP
jgi:hypothetical protein